VTRALPTRTLPPYPDLRQLRRQVKELLAGFIRGDGAAVAEVTAHYHGADAVTFALHDAQIVIARAYGFESWPELKAAVRGVAIERLTTPSAHAICIVSARSCACGPNSRRRARTTSAHCTMPSSMATSRSCVCSWRGAKARSGVYPYRETGSRLPSASAVNQTRPTARTGTPDHGRSRRRPSVSNPSVLASR
jgi:hypothetical protein